MAPCPRPARACAAVGGRALASGIEVAMHADTLICSLPSSAALHAVVADLQQAGRPKAGQIVIETSTLPLADKLAAAAALRKQGRQMVDASISGTATPAPQKNWVIYLIPFPYHPCTLSASLAVRLYCRRFAFAFTNDLEME